MIDTSALREKVLDLAIRGKLVPQDPNDEPASVLLERIRAEKEQMVKDGKLKAKDIKNDTIIFKGEDNLHYEKFSDGTVKCIEDEIPFDVPDGWTWARLRDICSMFAGKSKPTSEIKDVAFENSFPCYGGNGIRGYVDTYSYDGIYSIVGRQGALCGNVNIATGKFYATEHAVVVTLFNGIDFLWSNYILHGLKLNNYATGAAQPGLSVANVLNVLVAIPPRSEQIKISKQIEYTLKYINSIKKNEDGLLLVVESIKSKILDLAIRGKLVSQNQDDEPASVLLERIKAEKEELIKQGKIKRDKKESVIFKGDDNSYYEKIGDNITCIDDEIPFDLPDGIEFVRFKNLWELLSGRDLERDEYNSDKVGIPYITGASNFNNRHIEISRWTHSPQVITQKGDLLLTCKGTVGEMAINTFGDAHIARQVMAMRNVYGLNIDYLSLCINFYIEKIKKSAKGLIPGVSREDVLNLILPFPSEQYQKDVVKCVESLSEYINDIEKSLS